MKRSGLLALAGLAAGVVTLTGCSAGAYPVDYFQEMHYSPAIRRQEPPVMTAPDAAVGFQSAGGPQADLTAAPAYDFMPREQLAAIAQNPLPSNQTVLDMGATLFATNCAVCHGAQGNTQGQSAVVIAAQFTAAGANPPADLTGSATRARTDGEIFAIITHGQGTVPVPSDARDPAAYAQLTNMPSFQELLTVEERWALVRHIRTLQGQ
jgi:mono/diheme cytochrome c family protein